MRDKNQLGNHKIMLSKHMTASRSNICPHCVPHYVAPHWGKSTILTSWRGTLLCTSEEVKNQGFIPSKIKLPNLTLKSLKYRTDDIGMGRNRQVTCMICNKSMRSDNINRHMKSHTSDSISQQGSRPQDSGSRTTECLLCGKTILRKNISRHEEQSCRASCWRNLKRNREGAPNLLSIATSVNEQMSCV